METDMLCQAVQAQVRVMQLPGDLVEITRFAGPEAVALIAIAHGGRVDVARACLADLPRAERIAVWIAIGDAELLAGAAEQAQHSYQRARSLAVDRVDTPAALLATGAACGLALIAMGQGDLWAAALELRQALDCLHYSRLDPQAGFCDRVRLELCRLRDEVLENFVQQYCAAGGPE